MGLINFLHTAREESKRKSRVFKMRYDNLSLTEKKAFQDLVDDKYSGSSTIELMGIFPRIIIYLAIFALTFYYFLNIDIIEPLKSAALTIIYLLPLLLLIGIVFDFVNFFFRIKYERELLNVV